MPLPVGPQVSPPCRSDMDCPGRHCCGMTMTCMDESKCHALPTACESEAERTGKQVWCGFATSARECTLAGGHMVSGVCCSTAPKRGQQNAWLGQVTCATPRDIPLDLIGMWQDLPMWAKLATTAAAAAAVFYAAKAVMRNG